MTIKEVIEELIDMGYNVSFYKRKDGGVRITRINGERYSGSSGNKEARKITNSPMSEARTIALSKLKTPKGIGSYNKRRKPKLDDETRKRIQRAQRLYRKSGKKEGKPTIRNYRYILNTYGKEEADRLLRQAERRILGLAYVENVDALILRIEADLQKDPSEGMERALSLIRYKRMNFLDKWIAPIYEILYDWERELIEGDEAGAKIIAIIK